MRAAKLFGVALAVAGATTITAAAPALADSSACTADTACAGKATFTSYGEIFKVYDQVGDGYSAVLLYWLPDGTTHRAYASGGHGTSITVNLSLPEKSWITYRVCLGHKSDNSIKSSSCGVAKTDYA